MRNKFDDILSSPKVSDLLAATKLNELLHKKEEPVKEEKKSNTLVIVLAVIGVIAAVAGIAYCVYRFLTPDYLDEFDDDFDDEFEEDFGLSDEDAEEASSSEEV